MFLYDVRQIKEIEFAKEWLWDIRFPKAPKPFNEWFPATDVSFPVATVKSKTFSVFLSEYSIPEKTGEHKMTIGFLDDIKHTLLDWITAWMHLIVNISEKKGCVQTLQEAKKEVYIARLNSKRELLQVGKVPYIEGYWVYPEGSPTFVGGSESRPLTYSVDFVIVGEISSRPYIENMIEKGFLSRPSSTR